MTELIICEKPSAALKIANSLAEGKVKSSKTDGVVYYELKRKGEKVLVGCAVGHLFSLAEKEKKGLKYPVYEIKWKEIFQVRKKAAFAEKYYNTLKKLGKDIDKFIVATDYDIEGEVIGWNILRFIFNKKDGYRMKFSTLTKDELIESYEKASNHIDWGQAKAGEARHIMDWLWGINISRALTAAMQKAGNFKLMSSGRAQGPTLNLIVKREEEIKNFKPVPFWIVSIITDKFTAEHIKGKMWDENESQKILKTTNGKKAAVNKIDKKEFFVEPPYPFDLTS